MLSYDKPVEERISTVSAGGRKLSDDEVDILRMDPLEKVLVSVSFEGWACLSTDVFLCSFIYTAVSCFAQMHFDFDLMHSRPGAYFWGSISESFIGVLEAVVPDTLPDTHRYQIIKYGTIRISAAALHCLHDLTGQ